MKGKQEKNNKNQDSACSEKIREMLKSLLFDEKTKIHNNKYCLTKAIKKMTGAWLLTDNSKTNI
ncbi:MAG: hypothetical protein SPK71_00650 [Prevotella sp.]|nr:hypothetical protein [Prevotella sp.]